MKKVFYLITVLALGLTACNKNEIQTPDYAVQLTDWRYNKNKTTGDLDMTEQLAAEGFYVIRGPRMEHYDVDNNAPWYTWEFEVSAE